MEIISISAAELRHQRRYNSLSYFCYILNDYKIIFI